MRLMFDTNVLLDALLDREPWAEAATSLWKANDREALQGYISASSFTDIFYIARRLTTVEKAREAIRLCLGSFEVCPVDRQAIELADSMPGKDFEDNLQMAVAHLMELDAIVTRNVKDFLDSPVPILTPEEAIVELELD